MKKIVLLFVVLAMSPLWLMAAPADSVEIPASPYSPLTWSLLPLLTYAVTSALARAGRIKRHTHRYFWNLALLAVFAITCCFGVILACSLAYDWNLPGNSFYWMRTWHVNAGIFMAAAGVLHLSRRFHFFLKPPPHGPHG